MLQEAIDHARATSDDERVADIIERHGHAMVSAKPLAEFLIGPVEIVVQMLLFSVALFLWERRSFHKQDKKAATS